MTNKKIFSLLLIGLIIVPTLILAATGPAGTGLISPQDDTNLKITPPSDKLSVIMETVANYVIGILVVIAVFYIIKAGYEFVTASGDQEKISQARSSIMYAAIGIIIALIAKGIVNFIIGAIGTG